ncbi:peptidoglycan-binding protein [Alloiococcus sp. CFN-8]|uniref:peptidoglycan-binding domain-containing protein n=1 Tax=Alloiococcus sp. CFN-8 TaxID=3416081 RepID=UPI003CF6A0F3
MALGQLRVVVFQNDSSVPLPNSRVTITPLGQNNQEETEATVVITTNEQGQTETIDLTAPPIEYSQAPNQPVPYSFANIRVEAEGFIPTTINGVQIFPSLTALQNVNMVSNEVAAARGIDRVQINIPKHRLVEESEKKYRQDIVVNIQANTLVGIFPPKIPEAEEKPLPPAKSTVVLENVVVPEFIIVHTGVPDDNSAQNYTVGYKDYIKNVACCEIFSTWPESAIRANLYCIISFTLNRVYTEWYRSRGKNFTITNSTAFDQAFSPGRNIYDNIDRIVDEIFSTYIKRQGTKQPLFAQYCDGVRVSCPGWLTQWGSKNLADQGRTPYEILTNFYGTNIDLVRAPEVEGVPESYPGRTLSIGDTGTSVRSLQTYLNRISDNYPLIPKVPVDGEYGPSTEEAVRVFQQVFNLPETGRTDYATWYEISQIYVGVTKIAELRVGNEIEGFKSYEASYGQSNFTRRVFYPPTTYEKVNIPKVNYMDDGY